MDFPGAISSSHSGPGCPTSLAGREGRSHIVGRCRGFDPQSRETGDGQRTRIRRSESVAPMLLLAWFSSRRTDRPRRRGRLAFAFGTDYDRGRWTEQLTTVMTRLSERRSFHKGAYKWLAYRYIFFLSSSLILFI